MDKKIINDKLRPEYEIKLARLFYVRVNLFCYIAIFAFLVELLAGFTFFRKFLSTKDIPGIAGGLFFSLLLIATGRLSSSLSLQKIRAAFFSLLLTLIAVLAGPAHPDVMPYMGITLVVIAFFTSTLLLPWGAAETAFIGAFAFASYILVYHATASFANASIAGISSILLAVSISVGVLVKKSEQILRQKDFASRKEVEEKNAVMMKELELARKIQKTIIPHSVKTELADIAVTYLPMFYMGGDYAKFSIVDKDKLMFILADVTGHGVSSALLVNRLHTEIERLMREKAMPGDLLRSLDRFINEDFGKMGIYLSAFCGLLDFSKKQLIYSNHGHPPQILVQSRNNSIVLMDSQTFFMGIGMAEEQVYNTNVGFERGDRIILFTDGITEAKDAKGQLFGYERLERFVRQNAALDAAAFNEKLVQEIKAFETGGQSDDIFLLTVQTK